MTYSELHDKMQRLCPQTKEGWLTKVTIRIIDPFQGRISILNPSDLQLIVLDGSEELSLIALDER